MKNLWKYTLATILIALTSCTPQTPPAPDSVPTDIPQPNTHGKRRNHVKHLFAIDIAS